MPSRLACSRTLRRRSGRVERCGSNAQQITEAEKEDAMKHVLVTGGAGYVGNVLVSLLLEKGYKVTVYDALFFGDETLPTHDPRLTVIEGDIRETSKLARAFAGVDVVL